MAQRILLSWSSGKDAAWALRCLNRNPNVEIVGLLTTFNAAADRVAMHATRRELVDLQAQAVGLPLFPVMLPWPCSNADYKRLMRNALTKLKREHNLTGIAFGDIFLEDVRAYREQQIKPLELACHFPLWGTDTRELAQEMLDNGTRAILTCIDPAQCPQEFIGQHFDEALLDILPAAVDHCGENGEFHTFVYAHPEFSHELPVRIGDTVTRDGFVFSDVIATVKAAEK